MTMTSGMLNSGTGGNSRPPFFTFLWRLFKNDATFRGTVEFAAIGAVIYFFLIGFDAWQQPSGGKSAPTASAPKGQSPPAAQPPAPSPSQPASTPAPPAAGSTAAKRLQFFWPAEIATPQFLSRVLVEVDETSFRISSAADQPRLTAALTAYRSMRYAEMLKELAGANAQDRNVQFMRGLAHFNSAGTEPFKSAEPVLRQAASAGHQQAAALLGALLVAGPAGVTKNVTDGVRLIETAAASGDRLAKRLAGLGYLSADFSTFNPFKAAVFLRDAANAGDPQAMAHFARLSYDGIGTARDEKAAEDHLRRAAGAGLTLAQETLAALLLARHRDDATNDPAEAVRWLERAYQNGHSVYALNTLGFFHMHGNTKPPWLNFERAFVLVQNCSGLSHADCQYNNGYLLGFGRGTSRDMVRGLAHFIVSRDLGRHDASAKTLIAQLEKALSAQQNTAANELARTIRAALKPIPVALILQRADAALPSPWGAAPTPGTQPAQSKQALPQPPTQSKQASPAPLQQPAPPTLPIHKVEMPFALVLGDALPIIAPRAVDVDAETFKTSENRDRLKLLSALAAYRSGRYAAMKSELAEASPADANVLFMRGLADASLSTTEGWRDAGTALRAAAGKNHVQAKVLLASMQFFGQGVPKDVDAARRALETAAGSGSRYALRVLATAQVNGAFGTKDPSTGAETMRRSADAGDPMAMLQFARLLHDGTGLPKSAPLAEQYLRKSAGAGLTLAQRVLGNWILLQYREKVLGDPSEGFGLLARLALDIQDAPHITKLDPLLEQVVADLAAIRRQTTARAPWHEAAVDLAVFMIDHGREAPWKDDARGVKILKTCTDIAFNRCHFVYAAMLQTGRGGVARDPALAHAHYSIGSLNWKVATDRMDTLAKTMTPDQMSAARNLAKKLQSELKPVPFAPLFRALTQAPGPQLVSQTPARRVLGIDLANLSDELRRKFRINDSVTGAVVLGIDAKSNADGRLRPGDVIMEISQDAVASVDDFLAKIERLKKDGRRTALLRVTDKDGQRFVALPL